MDRRDTYAGGRASDQAIKSLMYDMADWCENVSSFFATRIVDEIHNVIPVMEKCMDLRQFCKPLGNYTSVRERYEAKSADALAQIHDWMVDNDIENLPDLYVLQDECIALGTAIHDAVHKHYSGTTHHEWVDEDGMPRSGIHIQKVVMTLGEYVKLAPSFFFMYQHCVLKISGEAVIESMCKLVARHVVGGRGLDFRKYGMESIVCWNAPNMHEADIFLTQVLNHYFTTN